MPLIRAGLVEAMAPRLRSSRSLGEYLPNERPGTARAWSGDMPKRKPPQPSKVWASTAKAALLAIASRAITLIYRSARGIVFSPEAILTLTVREIKYTL